MPSFSQAQKENLAPSMPLSRKYSDRRFSNSLIIIGFAKNWLRAGRPLASRHCRTQQSTSPVAIGGIVCSRLQDGNGLVGFKGFVTRRLCQVDGAHPKESNVFEHGDDRLAETSDPQGHFFEAEPFPLPDTAFQQDTSRKLAGHEPSLGRNAATRVFVVFVLTFEYKVSCRVRGDITLNWHRR